MFIFFTIFIFNHRNFQIQVYRNPAECQSPIGNGNKVLYFKIRNVKIQMTVQMHMLECQI